MAKAKSGLSESPLEIPGFENGYVIVTIRGDSPLIVNRCSETTLDSIEDKQTGKAKNKKAPRDIDREFMEHCHIIGGALPVKETFMEQRFGFPAIGIKKSIATAAMRFADAERVQMFGLITVHGPHRGLIEIKSPSPVMGRDAVKPPMQNMMLTYRPYFDPWEMAVPIKFVSSLISVEQLANAVRWAGISVGIGSWRIERGGDKGAFSIAKIERFQTAESFNEAMGRSAGLPLDAKRRFSHRAANRPSRNGSRARHAETSG